MALARGVPLLIVIFLLYYAAADKGLFSTHGVRRGRPVTRADRLGLHGRDLPLGAARGAARASANRRAAIGLSRAQAFALVVLPQALRTAIPPAMNLLVMLLKGATLISVIGVADMFYVAKIVAVNEFKPFELYTAAAVLVSP